MSNLRKDRGRSACGNGRTKQAADACAWRSVRRKKQNSARLLLRSFGTPEVCKEKHASGMSFCGKVPSREAGVSAGRSERRKKQNTARSLLRCFGTPEGTRTPDLLVRSQSLYPTELPAHTALSSALQYNSTPGKKMQALFSDFLHFLFRRKKPRQEDSMPRLYGYSVSRHLRQRLAFLRFVRAAEIRKNAITAATAARVSAR